LYKGLNRLTLDEALDFVRRSGISPEIQESRNHKTHPQVVAEIATDKGDWEILIYTWPSSSHAALISRIDNGGDHSSYWVDKASQFPDRIDDTWLHSFLKDIEL
jgi:hypothetical protein